MGSADDRTFNGGEEIVKLKESLKLLDIGEIIGKAKMHAAEAYSHAKEAYRLRDDFFKLIEQHAYVDLDSGTKERLSLAAASLNAALGVADAASDAGSDQGKPTLSTELDSRERSAHREAVARDKKVLSREEEEIKLEQQGCEKMAHLEAVREGLALEEVADAANIAASATDPDQDNPAASTKLDYVDAANVAASASDSDQGIPSLLAAQTASFFSSLTQTVSTSLDAGEKRPRREAVREGLARGKQDFSREEERIRLEAQVEAKNECKKKKREEESRMRDDKRKQKMDKNTKPKDKDKGKGKNESLQKLVIKRISRWTSAALVVSVNPRFSQLSSTYNLCRKVSKEKSSEQLNNVYELEEDGQFPSVVKSMDSWPCGNIGFILRHLVRTHKSKEDMGRSGCMTCWLYCHYQCLSKSTSWPQSLVSTNSFWGGQRAYSFVRVHGVSFYCDWSP
ncbi:hypothetical protein Bca52824_047633 [Brassica carinata]|uniref:phosphatidate cytidylyltransferase n=1 Tax=Brassica carinata TaxID=52824 RepID=A0A8X7URC7_BRACI|nr:hypothetical protein Bca52824_047633 [Brassica carinata]